MRLATGILIAPLRPAVLLAKQAATLDVLSQGRLDLGVGTGWQREEYDAEGLDFAARGQLLTDTLAACKALWRDTPAAIDTPSLSFTDIYCDPKPRQPDGVPLWIAGTLHARNLDRLVRYGDAWIPIMGETVEGIAAGAKRSRDAWTDAGRDPDAAAGAGAGAHRPRRRQPARHRPQHGIRARTASRPAPPTCTSRCRRTAANPTRAPGRARRRSSDSASDAVA